MVDNAAPCPFCGAGKTEQRNNTYWTGMRSVVASVDIMHWCIRDGGLPSDFRRVTGRTLEEALAVYNRRANG